MRQRLAQGIGLESLPILPNRDTVSEYYTYYSSLQRE